ncbi:sigma 54-interacting transcriptional regulator [Sodalis sp. dw_96]|uniref:sigma 54-interacting transcriptional regulator n=1 Tax=Sodalis sp. dw_96 TaxID=2719794 RepID=UPI001BD4F6B3|nr:sigma 54-interacting transcriptional regulator [Sodalis sp. dw_96]
MKKLPHFCIISPTADLTENIAGIKAHYAGKANITIIESSLTGIEETLKQLPLDDYDIFISRGGMVRLLELCIKQPIIEIKTSAYDIIDALAPYRNQPCIGIVGYISVINGSRKIAAMLNIPLKIFSVPDMSLPTINRIRQQVHQQMASGEVERLIGDAISTDYFDLPAERCTLLNTGAESIERALEEALTVYRGLARQRVENRQLQTLIDAVSKAIITVNGRGEILHSNSQAMSMLGLTQRAGDNLQRYLTLGSLSRFNEQYDVNESLIIDSGAYGSLLAKVTPIIEDGETDRLIITLQKAATVRGEEQAIRLKEAEKRNFQARYGFNDFITGHPEMARRLQLAATYAKTDATILLIGENGTGKEIIAQSIHNASERRDKMFVPVNCGAIPPDILESELFGYVEGAFSGASRKGKTGLFELAHGGTLFLDEITELDKSLQSKLLRVLQERQLIRLGSDRIIPIDVRIIAATNRNIQTFVQEGGFREDLYYRINVLKITAMPLRERPEDIRAIGEYWLSRYRRRYDLPPLRLAADLWRFLTRYDWPGNARQLGNIMERLALSAAGDTLDLDQAALYIEDLTGAQQHTAKKACSHCDLLEGNYTQIRRAILERVIARQGYNKSRTARMLDVDRTSINRWLMKP